MTLALLTLLTLGQGEADALEAQPPPPEQSAQPAQPAQPEAVTPPAPAQGPGFEVDPGWAREGAYAGFALAAVPAGLGIASVVSMWLGNQTAQDWLQVGAGLSAPLVALVPTFAGRSAVLRYEELERRPKIFRIIGWVMVIYGAVGLAGGVAFGRLWAFIAEKTGFSWGSIGGGGANVEQTAVTVGRIIGTVTTLFSVAVATAGVVFVSLGAKTSADRAVVPSVAVVPLPGGGYAAMAGLNGRF